MIHIGNGVSIFKDTIVAIFSMETVMESRETRLFINSLIESNHIDNNLGRDVKSYILCLNDSKTKKKDKSSYKVYLSNISSESIAKRVNIYGQDWRKVNGQ